MSPSNDLRAFESPVRSADGVSSAAWAIWQKSSGDVSFPSLMEGMLVGWRFYPESEWAQYGIRPPEGAILHGAWRSADARAFAFFVRADAVRGSSGPAALLHVTGPEKLLNEIDSKINGLKNTLLGWERRKLKDARSQTSFDGVHKSKSLNRLIALVGVFAVVINALSLYLRKIPPPNINITYLAIIFNVLLAAVHITALLLLLLLILICIVYVIRYGVLLVRNLK